MSKLPDKLAKKWEEADANPGTKVHLGHIVVCDSCDKDYSDDTESSGGFIFSSSAYGPCCAARMMKGIVMYNEQRFIKAQCPQGKSFRDFVIAYRGDDDFIRITHRAGK